MIEKIIELNGRKLVPELPINKSKEVYKKEIPENLPQLRNLYNVSRFINFKEKEINKRR